MAFPLYRPIRNPFSDRFTNIMSQDRTTIGRAGRKRSNQAAELSDVSIEDDSKEFSKDDVMCQPVSARRDQSNKGAETGEERQVRRFSCAGKKRGSAKGIRGSTDDHSAKSHGDYTVGSGERETMNDTSDVKQSADSSRPVIRIPASSVHAATLHSSEYGRPVDSTTIGVESSSSDETVQRSDRLDNPAAMELDSHSPEEDEESDGERISGMPDWAAELDEVVPGVKVISIKDVRHFVRLVVGYSRSSFLSLLMNTGC
jgi:hypothetical protein